MNITDTELFENNQLAFGSIFHKIDIYNRNLKYAIYEGRYNEILLSVNERAAVNEMIRTIKLHILHEGFLDSIKVGANKIKQTATNVINKAANLPEQARKAYEFCDAILKKGITKVSELIKFFAELLSKLGDTIREAIIKLGGFKASAVSESASDTAKSEDEKLFLKGVEEYITKRWADKKLYESNLLDTVTDKIQSNKFLLIVIMSNNSGKKLSWWKTLLVSVVGSIAINALVPAIALAMGAAAPTAAMAASVCLFIWQGRNVVKILVNRRIMQKQHNEEKFWNAAVVILLIITVGTAVIFQLPVVKKFMADLFSKAVDSVDQWTDGKITEFLTLFSGKEPSVEQIQEALKNSGDIKPANNDLNSEAVNKVKDQIAAWMDGKAATGMATKAGETCQIDVAGVDAYVCNGNANLIHAAKAIQGEVEKLGGKIVTSVSSNAHGKTYLLDVIFPEGTGINNLSDTAQNALKAAGADTTEFVKLVNNAIEIPVPPVEPDIVTTVVEPVDVKDLFAGVGIELMFKKFNGQFKISFQPEEKHKPYLVISSYKNMKKSELDTLIDQLGNIANKQGMKQLAALELFQKRYTSELIDSLYSKKGVTEANDTADNNAAINNVVDAANKVNALDDMNLVMFTKIKDGDKTTEYPIIALNYRTMYACDLIQSPKLGTKIHPYFFKGLFNYVSFKPANDNEESEELIKKCLTSLLVKSAKDLSKIYQTTIGEVKHLLKKNEWIAKADDNDAERFELGNFTTSEFVDILNNPEDSYKYFNSKYAKRITATEEETGKVYGVKDDSEKEHSKKSDNKVKQPDNKTEQPDNKVEQPEDKTAAAEEQPKKSNEEPKETSEEKPKHIIKTEKTSEETDKKKEDVAKDLISMESFFRFEILPMFDKGEDAYNDLKRNKFLAKRCLKHNGKIKEDIISDIYLVGAINDKYPHLGKASDLDEIWKKVYNKLLKRRHKSAEANKIYAAKRIKKIKYLYDIIAKYVNPEVKENYDFNETILN